MFYATSVDTTTPQLTITTQWNDPILAPPQTNTNPAISTGEQPLRPFVSSRPPDPPPYVPNLGITTADRPRQAQSMDTRPIMLDPPGDPRLSLIVPSLTTTDRARLAQPVDVRPDMGTTLKRRCVERTSRPPQIPRCQPLTVLVENIPNRRDEHRDVGQMWIAEALQFVDGQSTANNLTTRLVKQDILYVNGQPTAVNRMQGLLYQGNNPTVITIYEADRYQIFWLFHLIHDSVESIFITDNGHEAYKAPLVLPLSGDYVRHILQGGHRDQFAGPILVNTADWLTKYNAWAKQ